MAKLPDRRFFQDLRNQSIRDGKDYRQSYESSAMAKYILPYRRINLDAINQLRQSSILRKSIHPRWKSFPTIVLRKTIHPRWQSFPTIVNPSAMAKLSFFPIVDSISLLFLSEINPSAMAKLPDNRDNTS